MVDVGTLIQLAFDIYGKYFKYIVIIGLGIYIPVGVVNELLLPEGSLLELPQSPDISALLRILFGLGMVMVAVLPLETAALTYFVWQKLKGEDVVPEGIMDATFGNWHKLFVTALIYYSVVCFAMILIFPAVIIGVWAHFGENIVVTEKKSGIAALRKSAAIVKGHWWRTAFILFMLWFASLVLKTMISVGVVFVLIFVELLFGSMSLVAQVVVILASAVAETICMLFKLIGALYFFNLYYIAERMEQDAIL